MNLQVAEQVVIFLPSVVESLIEWHKKETLGALAQPFCEYQSHTCLSSQLDLCISPNFNLELTKKNRDLVIDLL